MFDRVIVAVVNLPWRKGKTASSAEERVGFVTNAEPRHLDNVDVEPFSTLLVSTLRASAGRWRSSKGCARSDFEYELEINQLNRRQDPEIESVYLMASAKLQFPELERHQGAGDVWR